MEKNVRFYICPICGNQIGMIKNCGPKVMCCGQEMIIMEPHQNDEGKEKHLPSYEIVDNIIKVKVGDLTHSMDNEHYIMWVALVGEHRTIRQTLIENDKLEVDFEYMTNSSIYVYCNKHGLWKTEIVE